MESINAPKPKPQTATPIDPRFCAREMESSRERLLDLTLRNKLLNFAPADPAHHDDGRAHKFLLVQGKIKAIWSRLMDEEKDLKNTALRENLPRKRSSKGTRSAETPGEPGAERIPPRKNYRLKSRA